MPLSSLVRRRTAPLHTATLLGAAALVASPAPPAAHAAEDPLCVTTPGSRNEYPGPSASTAYDDTFNPSQPVPAGLLADRYDPQGLVTFSNWNGTSEDVLLISAYHDANGNKVPDGSSGIFGVVINGKRAGLGLGRMLVPNGHVGGIGVYQGFLYVGTESTSRPTSSARSATRSRAPTPAGSTTTPPRRTPPRTASASSAPGTGTCGPVTSARPRPRTSTATSRSARRPGSWPTSPRPSPTRRRRPRASSSPRTG